ncbi:MAG: radical SAM protein [Candidatus Thorarchaeota archaeon]|nr:radical SAM protein [Candidatus Thorarchaeota archaeon]
MYEPAMELVEFVRISLGTAMKLGLESGKVPENFTTAFLMTYHPGGCSANCAFCPQATTSDSDPEMLSRIGWPRFKVEDVERELAREGKFQRVCIQTLNYDGVVEDVIALAGIARNAKGAKISVCIHPIDVDEMIRIKEAEVERIGIAFDACTPALFDRIKGNSRNSDYTWGKHIAAVKKAQSIFGEDKVTTHLIIGLGESESDVVEFLFLMKSMNIRVGLFAFTPVEGTALAKEEPPNLGMYRRVQILRYLIMKEAITKEELQLDEHGRMVFMKNEDDLRELLASGTAFQVSGCPGCNRPFYNERPRGPMYNYPRPLYQDEIEQALNDAGLVKIWTSSDS